MNPVLEMMATVGDSTMVEVVGVALVVVGEGEEEEEEEEEEEDAVMEVVFVPSRLRENCVADIPPPPPAPPPPPPPPPMDSD